MLMLVVILSFGFTAHTESMPVSAAVCEAVAQDLVRTELVLGAHCR